MDCILIQDKRQSRLMNNVKPEYPSSNIENKASIGSRNRYWFGVLLRTVERAPTLSAGYKIPPRQLRLHLLPDLIVLR